MSNDLLQVCNEIIEVSSPWEHKLSNLAINSARLAKFTIALIYKLKFGFEDGDPSDAQTVAEMDERLERLWEETE